MPHRNPIFRFRGEHNFFRNKNSDDRGLLLLDLLLGIALLSFCFYQLVVYQNFRVDSARRFERAATIAESINKVSAAVWGRDCAGGQIFDDGGNQSRALLHENPGCRPLMTALTDSTFTGWVERRSVIDSYHSSYRHNVDLPAYNGLEIPGPILGVLTAVAGVRERPPVVFSYVDRYRIADCDANNTPQPVRTVTAAIEDTAVSYSSASDAADRFDTISRLDLESSWDVSTLTVTSPPLEEHLGWVTRQSPQRPVVPQHWEDAQSWVPLPSDQYAHALYASTTDQNPTGGLVVQGRWWRTDNADGSPADSWCWVLTAPQGCVKFRNDPNPPVWVLVEAGKGVNVLNLQESDVCGRGDDPPIHPVGETSIVLGKANPAPVPK